MDGGGKGRGLVTFDPPPFTTISRSAPTAPAAPPPAGGGEGGGPPAPPPNLTSNRRLQQTQAQVDEVRGRGFGGGEGAGLGERRRGLEVKNGRGLVANQAWLLWGGGAWARARYCIG